MNNKRLWASIIVFVAVVVGLLATVISSGNTPVLGLDLKGGLSVIYATEEEADEEQLTIVRDLMREQLESFGIAEPDVRVEGDNIIVDLPGVEDQASAFEALNVSGIVNIRPVIVCGPGLTANPALGQDVLPIVGEDNECLVGDEIDQLNLLANAELVGTVPGVVSISANRTLNEAGNSTSSLLVVLEPGADPTPLVEALDKDLNSGSAIAQLNPTVVCESTDECEIRFTAGTGGVFSRGSAGAEIDQRTGGWVVTVDLNGSAQRYWNLLANECFSRASTCPSGQLAIVLDDVIQSAPTVQTNQFEGSVQISGAFSEDEVRSLARVLNRGAFPVAVTQQRAETVSPTAGQDALNAAIISGLVGIALVLALMVAYYRKLAVVIISGLMVWGMTVFTLASLVSQATNYALTLAGATGIIVAIGVTVDTYVVFFERLRDEARKGRSIRNAAPRSFQATWRTIVSADLVSLMASLILFWLSVGSVKGFALYLGLTTICDLLVCWFFTRPAVFLLSQTRWLENDSGGATASSIDAIGAPA